MAIEDLRIDLSTGWPPAAHRTRLVGYMKNQQLFDGEHRRRFAIDRKQYQSVRYIVANLPQMISTFAADLLFGEEPDFLAAHKEERAQQAGQEWLNDCIERNGLHAMNYEAALGCSFRGDVVYKARWGVRNKAREDEEEEAIIESVPPDIYFPELSGDSSRQVLSATLAWEKVLVVAGQQHVYLRIEQHTPGLIQNFLFEKGNTPRPVQVPLATLEEYADLPEEIATGINDILVVHVPNMREGTRFWGITDYQALESLFEAINNRMTQIDVVLDKHVAPKLLVPPALVDEHGNVHLDELEVVSLDRGDQPPSYLTWEAQLTAAYTQIEKLLEFIFIVAEIPPCALGLDRYGVAESGRALRLRMMRALAKINRKRTYFNAGLRKVLFLAQQLAVIHGKAGIEPMEPDIQWADGLPEDMVEAVDIEEKRLRAGNTSLESSVRRLDGADAVETEMQRIRDEESDMATLTGAAGARGGEALPVGSEEEEEGG